jgi:hypothetical protein
MKLTNALWALARRPKIRKDAVPAKPSPRLVGLIDHSGTPSSALESKIARNVPHFKLGLKEVHL